MSRYELVAVAILLFLGTGCSNNATEPTVTSEPVPAVLKAPGNAVELGTAAVQTSAGERACTSRGFEIISRFDELTESTRKYCRFDDASECPLDEYAIGTCGPGQGAASLTNPGLLRNLVVETTCTETDPPVCGVNGHSYANRCIAVQAGISLAHEGMCTETEIDAASPRLITRANSRTSAIERATQIISNNQQSTSATPPPTLDPAVSTQGATPDWLSTVIALIEAENPTSPRMHVDACIYNSRVVYYETNGTEELPSTAYDTNGAIICNPNRDFAGFCPSFASKKSGCERVYTDNR